MVFPVVMYRCESWAIKKNCGFGEDSWKSLGLQGDQASQSPKIFIGRTNAEAPILWPSDAKSRLIGKDPDAGKD